MKITSKVKYFFRFALLQTILTWVTIFYFDNFLIGNYKEGLLIISNNLIEDKDRFFSFVPNSFIKIDIFLAIFIMIFLLLLYSTKFYSYVNELTFTTDKGFLDEFFPIYLIWSASFLSFLQLFRFTAVSRAYLVLFTFIVPLILVIFRNSQFLSSLLGRNITDENYITFNLEDTSIFNEIRLLKFRNKIKSFENSSVKNNELIKNKIEEVNKLNKLNLIVINYQNENKITPEFENYLLNLNKKILLIGNNPIKFNSNFYFRSSQSSNQNLIYINNDIQYGSSYIIKRILDIFISIFSLILLLPLTTFISLLIMIKAGRPVLTKQTRVGLHGNNFLMYKFRTMKIDSHQKRSELSSKNLKTGPLFKIDNDPRIIKGLHFIRKYSIDEIPQFLNVIKGEMSVVGPRPLFPEDNEHYDSIFIRRLNVLPGITGLLQINERNTDDFLIWHKYDVEYIDSWSIFLDLKIIFKTPFSIFFRNTKGV